MKICNKPLVIIINGSGGVGKDTFCKFVNRYIRSENYSTVDKVKKAIEILEGTNLPKDEKYRELCSDIKLAWTKYNNGPLLYVLEKAKECKKDIMFIHIREPKEIEKTKRKLISMRINCVTLLITNKNVKQIKSNMADANVYNYKYDYIVNNDSNKLKLFIETSKFCRIIRKKYLKKRG